MPAYFNDAQRQATKDAGTDRRASRCMRIINEPTAATLAYGLDKKESGRIAVYDLGGGTFDVSILEIGDGVFEVLATNGDTHLGGDDFDEVLINYVADDFQKASQGIDIRSDAMALQRLKEACEKAKCELSSATCRPTSTCRSSRRTRRGPKHLTHDASTARSSSSLVEGLDRAHQATPCQQRPQATPASSRAKVDEVILVGGSTRIPAVQEKVKKLFGKEPNKSVNPDEVVAVGAAIQGGILGR